MEKELEIIHLIKTTLLRRGNGETKDDPIRIITQYWDMEGNLLFEVDKLKKHVDYNFTL